MMSNRRRPKPRARRQQSVATLIAAGLIGAVGTQWWIVGTPIPAIVADALPVLQTQLSESHFVLCNGGSPGDCVVDGDTIHFGGQKIRMIDYDTPEISEPKCASEEALGRRAKLRLLELLNSGPVEIRPQGGRDEDRYGRKLRLVLVRGRSVGDLLVSEGLAWPWEGHKHQWC